MAFVRKDSLTPIERFAALEHGEPVDRLPCVPVVGNTSARVIGVKVSEFRGNGKLIAKAQIASYRRFRYDNIRVFTDLYTQAEAMGAEVHYPEDETAYLKAPVIERVGEIGNLRSADPRKDGNLPAHIEAASRALEAVGKEVPVTCALTGPFTNASFLIGAENLVRLTLKNPGAVHRLCEVSLATNLAYAEAILATGATPSVTEPMASSTVIGPRQFREFCYPYLKRLIGFISLRGKGVTLHICGKTLPVLDLMAETGASTLSLDNDVDLGQAKDKVGDKVRLMGNVHPTAVMLQGTLVEVRSAVRSCVSKAWDNPKGFVVASGCSLPVETPFENIDAMMGAVREIGWPVNPSLFEN